MQCCVLVLLLLTASVACTWVSNGCLEGYLPLAPNFCISVTRPGTWMEAIASCPMPTSSFGQIVFYKENDTMYKLNQKNIIQMYGDNLKGLLLQMGLQEVWWKDMNSVLVPDSNIHEFDWTESQFHSPYLSRWRWSNSSESACESYNLVTGQSRRRSCFSSDPNLQFSYFCVRLQNETREFVQTVSCPEGFESGFGADKYCFSLKYIHNNYSVVQSGLHSDHTKRNNWHRAKRSCSNNDANIQMLQRGYRYLLNHIIQYCNSDKIYPLGIQRLRNGELVWIGDGIKYKAIDDEDLMHYNDYLSRNELRIPPRTAQILPPVSAEEPVGAVNLETGVFYLAHSNSTFRCVVCETLRRTDNEPALFLRHTNGQSLTLTMVNLVSQRTAVVCYTDSSNTNISLPNYKQRTITISKIYSDNGQYYDQGSGQDYDEVYDDESVLITEELDAVDDIFFLRINNGVTAGTHTNTDSVKKWHYRIARSNTSANLEIPFTEYNSGMHWCIGTNRITLLPIFTEKVSVVLPNDGSYIRYSVLVEILKLRGDPQLPAYVASLGRNFSSALAQVLHVTDGVIELKRIANDDSQLLFHVTLSPDHTALAAAEGAEVTDGCRIVSIRKNGDECSQKSVTSDATGKSHKLHGAKLGTRIVKKPRLRVNCNDTAYICENSNLGDATWQEISPNSSNWQVEWGKSCQTMYTDAVNDLHALSGAAISSNRLSEVTRVIHMLLSSGFKFAHPNTHALHDIDKILTNMVFDRSSNGVVQHVRSGVSILVSDLSHNASDSVVGISVETRNGEDILRAIRSNHGETSSAYPSETEIRVVLPKAIIKNKSRLSFAVFSDVNAFEAELTDVRVNSRVLNIILSNGNDATSTLAEGQFIDIMLKPIRTITSGLERKTCAFWDLEKRIWSEEGCVFQQETKDGMGVCRCYHLTHFAQIITGSGSPLPPGHQKALEVISIIGCTLSLFGLLVIVVTAVVFKNWRAELGNKILLNLSAALTMNLVIFFLVHGGVGGNDGPDCIAIGVLLHYSVLACFCWMLVMSGLQVMRLLTMLGSKGIPNLLLKASVLGWGVPFLPIIILLSIGPEIYVPTLTMGFDRGFCYPTGVAFYLTIAAPVSLIVIINLVIYIVIICRICSCFGWGALNTGLQRHGITDGLLAMRRLRTLIFLFFLFGITWTFGFLVQYLFFTYLFCITATLQGFVIFVFFFIIEKKSRGYWRKRLSDPLGRSKSYRSGDTFASTVTTAVTKSTHFSESIPLRKQVDKSTSMRKYIHDVSVVPEQVLEDQIFTQPIGSISNTPVSLESQAEVLETHAQLNNQIDPSVYVLGENEQISKAEDIPTNSTSSQQKNIVPKLPVACTQVSSQGLLLNRDEEAIICVQENVLVDPPGLLEIDKQKQLSPHDARFPRTLQQYREEVINQQQGDIICPKGNSCQYGFEQKPSICEEIIHGQADDPQQLKGDGTESHSHSVNTGNGISVENALHKNEEQNRNRKFQRRIEENVGYEKRNSLDDGRPTTSNKYFKIKNVTHRKPQKLRECEDNDDGAEEEVEAEDGEEREKEDDVVEENEGLNGRAQTCLRLEVGGEIPKYPLQNTEEDYAKSLNSMRYEDEEDYTKGVDPVQHDEHNDKTQNSHQEFNLVHKSPHSDYTSLQSRENEGSQQQHLVDSKEQMLHLGQELCISEGSHFKEVPDFFDSSSGLSPEPTQETALGDHATRTSSSTPSEPLNTSHVTRSPFLVKCGITRNS